MSTVKKKTAIVLNNLFLLPVLISDHGGGYNTYANAWLFKNPFYNTVVITQ